MSKFKVCMLGAFAVGKTSLVQRYVHSIFSEKYHTTLGVKIDKKSLLLGGKPFDFLLWDLAGEDEFIHVRSSYLRGSAGGVLVADGTRPETLDIVLELRDLLFDEVGEVPVVLMINKSDLREQWTVDDTRLREMVGEGWMLVETSAKDGNNVDKAFELLARELLAGSS